MSTRVQPGAVVARVYFTLADPRSIGTPIDTHTEACTAALNHKLAYMAVASDREMWRVWIAERWVIEHADGGSLDIEIDRVEYDPHHILTAQKEGTAP